MFNTMNIHIFKFYVFKEYVEYYFALMFGTFCKIKNATMKNKSKRINP